MKKVYALAAFLLVLLKISVCFAEEGAGFKEITLKPFDEVKQGQTIFINIKTPEPLEDPVFKFKNKKYRLFNLKENEYTGLLGINVLEKPGTYKISMKDKTGNLNDRAFIKIIKNDLPSQNIKVTKQMAGLTASKRELSRIKKMKGTVTNTFLGALPPYDSPAEGCVNSIFGLKRYYNGKFSGNYHKGIDIKADEGVPVRAITGGKVIFAEQFRLHGGSVAVDHGQGLVSLYIHLSKIDVTTGKQVASGQKIGEVGKTGFATGPHLHWGLYINGTPVDPMIDWIKPVKICM